MSPLDRPIHEEWSDKNGAALGGKYLGVSAEETSRAMSRAVGQVSGSFRHASNSGDFSSSESKKSPADTLRELGIAGHLDEVHLEVSCYGHPEDTVVSGTVRSYLAAGEGAALDIIEFYGSIDVPTVSVTTWVLRPQLRLSGRG